MREGQQMKSGPARGVRRSDGTIQAVVKLDPDTFEAVRQRAVREETSFAEQVRILLEWGLEDDQPEPTAD